MKKAILDTGVIISLIDREDPDRRKLAKSVYEFLKSNGVQILYSQRTKNELLKKPSEQRLDFLKNHEMSPYFLGNENWEQIEGTWENIASSWNTSEEETEIYNRLNSWLKKEKDLQDRGILLDAVYSGCSYFIHENPRDFKKIAPEFWNEFKIIEFDLINSSLPEVINKY